MFHRESISWRLGPVIIVLVDAVFIGNQQISFLHQVVELFWVACISVAQDLP